MTTKNITAAAAYDAARAARAAAATALERAKERCYKTNKALTAAESAHATALRDYLDSERAANS